MVNRVFIPSIFAQAGNMLLLRILPLTGEKFPYDGDAMVLTGQRVTEWTARECETRRIGVTRS